jgi:hypothetical protein
LENLKALGSGLTIDISKSSASLKKLARSNAPACGRQGIQIAEFKTFEKKDFPRRNLSDRLDVWNPGELPSTLTPERLREPHPSIPHNPLIAESLFLAHYIEKAGMSFKNSTTTA